MTSPLLNYATVVFDLKNNAKKFISVSHFEIAGAKVLLLVKDSMEPTARVSPTASDQYIIWIYRGLLEACLNFVNTNVRAYYSAIRATTLFDEATFLRAVCSCMTEYIFLHEYSHITRGHFSYLEPRKGSWRDTPELEVEDKRFVECDADIYAANKLFARVHSVFQEPRNNSRLHDLMQAYTVGIRAMFEMLYSISGVEDDIHLESDHPHSLIRAYIAISMGVTGPVSQRVGSVAEESQKMAMSELLSYETFLCNSRPIDPYFLKLQHKRELDIWTSRTDDLTPYFQLRVHKISVLTKVLGWINQHFRW
ncbi:hypothetical protein OH710_24600 [Pseudomonas capsici]|uniref:hypothetical protein n=1 Tax=Pseudomonas capsici TaxID=2810614 RepID=UPI0021F1EA20|nr:hypothetical protein [Pseudomonas capsici]MCV4275826.1 hypothetical protein [Pseudomonas capsici]